MSKKGDSLSGLSNALSGSSSSDDSIPDSFKKLAEVEEDDLDPRLVHSSTGVGVYYSGDGAEHSGRDRHDLVEEVVKHVNGDYDIYAWNDYELRDVADLTIYLLDQLDADNADEFEDDKGPRLIGKEVVNYLEEFVEKDGEPEYLEGF